MFDLCNLISLLSRVEITEKFTLLLFKKDFGHRPEGTQRQDIRSRAKAARSSPPLDLETPLFSPRFRFYAHSSLISAP